MTVSLDASQHIIKAITVFSSRKAEVIRTFTVDLAEGQNEIVITSLSSCMDTESARVTGLGDAVLFDVVCTVDNAADFDNTSRDVLTALERRRDMLTEKKTLCKDAREVITQFGQSLEAEHATVETVQSFLDSLVPRSSDALENLEKLDKDIADVTKEIQKETRRLEKERRREAAYGRVSAVIMAKRSGKVEVSLTYMVSNASWSPIYDLRAATEDGKPSGTVFLHYRASILQNTGEDWRDTSISVSTATPGTWSSIPARRSMKIVPVPPPGGFKPPPPPPSLAARAPAPASAPRAIDFATRSAVMKKRASASAPLFGGAGEDDWDAVDENEELDGATEKSVKPWTESKAVVTQGAVASSFRIEGKCTIPSEPTAHKVAIAILPFEAKINYIAVPRSRPLAFLQTEVKNTSEYRLLAGSVHVFLDDSPVSKTHINVFKCTLGPDPLLRVKYTRLPRTVASSGSAYAAQTKVTTYKLYTTLSNAHTFPVKGILVQDAAPDAGETSQDSNAPGIRVVVKKPEGLGEAAPGTLVDVPSASPSSTYSVKVRWEEDGGEKEGKYVWIVDLGPGEEVKLETEYEIRAPADFNWQINEDFFQ